MRKLRKFQPFQKVLVITPDDEQVEGVVIKSITMPNDRDGIVLCEDGSKVTEHQYLVALLFEDGTITEKHVPVYEGGMIPNVKTFGDAMDALKSGYAVTRSNWIPGKYLFLLPGAKVPADKCFTEPLISIAKKQGFVECLPAIRLVSGVEVMTGYTPTQIEMLDANWKLIQNAV